MKRRPCAAIFMTPVIQWNGDVTTCCHDPKLDLIIGNVNETPLDELWNSEEMTKRRLLQIKGDFSYPQRCLNCKNVDGIEITYEQVIDYLISIGREDLIEQYARHHKFKLKPKYKVLSRKIKTIEIDPFLPSKQQWDKEHGTYHGEDGFQKGYSFIFGKNNGYYEYQLPIEKGEYEIELSMASADWEKGRTSNADIFLNGKKTAEYPLSPLSAGTGRDYTFRITVNDEAVSILRIQSSESSAGICILGNPIQKRLKSANIKIRKIGQ